MSKDESTPPPALADIDAKLDRIAATCAQASLQAARTARLIDAGQQLSARDRMALVDIVEKLQRLYTSLATTRRPASLTVVADVPQAIEAEKSGRADEISVVNIRLPWAPSRLVPIPNRHLRYLLFSLTSFALGGGLMRLMHWLGWMR